MHMHREVIKWLQSLDLSFQVKNPRRDLANGFVVAEILSRYDKEVQMHSIDTGLSVARRIDNWQQIRKILTRLGCRTISWELMTHTLEAREGKGRELLELLFTFLTKKELKANPAFEATTTFVELPAYQRPTAAKLLRDHNDETNDRVSKLTGDLDQQRKLALNTQLLQRHKEDMIVAKAVEPDRYRPMPKVGAQLAGKGGAAAAAGKDGASSARARPKSQTVRELAVRTIDDNVLKTFAERDAAEKEEAFRSGFNPNDDLATSLSRVCQRPLGAAGLLEQIDALTGADAGDYFTKFVQSRARIPAEPRNATWNALMESAQNIAKLVAQHPEQFAHLTIAFSFVFGREAASAAPSSGAASASPDTTQALHLLSRVGSACLSINPDAAATIVRRTLIPAMLQSLASGSPAFCERMAALLCAFTNCNHQDSLRRLIGLLEPTLAAPSSPASDRFFAVVSRIMAAVDFSVCFGGAALCNHYATAAIHSSFPVSRACGLLMLKLLVASDTTLVMHHLPTIIAASADANWEVRINQLDLLGSLQNQLLFASPADTTIDAGNADERAALMELAAAWLPAIGEALRKTFVSFRNASGTNKRLALRATVAFVDNNRDAQLAREFLDMFFSFDDGQRHGLVHSAPQGLESRPVEAIPGRAQAFYPVGALYEAWYGAALAEALTAHASSYSTFDVLTLLEPLVLGQELGSQRDFWLGVAHALRADLLAPIFNPANCRGVAEKDLGTCAEMAYSIATKYYAEISGDAIDEGANFHDVQDQAVDWLQANLGSA